MGRTEDKRRTWIRQKEDRSWVGYVMRSGRVVMLDRNVQDQEAGAPLARVVTSCVTQVKLPHAAAAAAHTT